MQVALDGFENRSLALRRVYDGHQEVRNGRVRQGCQNRRRRSGTGAAGGSRREQDLPFLISMERSTRLTTRALIEVDPFRKERWKVQK